MHMHEYRIDLFEHENVKTEAACYHLLCDRPVETDVNYLAVPWSVLLNQHQLHTPEIRLEGGFTVCQHVRFQEVIPICVQIGLDTMFTPHVEIGFEAQPPRWMRLACRTPFLRSRVIERAEAFRRFRVLPCPHLAVNSSPPQQKDIWYSFIGYNTHPVRDAVFALPARPDTIVRERGAWHFEVEDPRQRETELKEYLDVLSRSRYSLCPRGFGPGTLRFWESLVAGAIPVLIADTVQLPTGVDWDSCTVRVPEQRAPELESILSSISPEQERQLRDGCLKAAEQFTGPNLISCIHAVYSSHCQRRQAA